MSQPSDSFAQALAVLDQWEADIAHGNFLAAREGPIQLRAALAQASPGPGVKVPAMCPDCWREFEVET